MKVAILIVLSLLTVLPISAKRIYTLPKSDFILQFADSLKHLTKARQVDTAYSQFRHRIYCFRKDGAKIWLVVSGNSILILKHNNGKKRKLILTSIRYNNGIVEALEPNVLMVKPATTAYYLNDVSSIEVVGTTAERERAYFDVDSCRILLKMKNDSLLKSYANDSQYVIHLITKSSSNKDTLAILENISYNLKFKNGVSVLYGVVQRITNDSIYISNRFNSKTAEADKVEYKIYGYPIKDISELQLLHSGGFYYRKKKAEEFDIVVFKDTRREYHSCWFSMDWETGEIDLVRWWLTNRKFKLVYEKDGRVYWYGA